MQVQHGRPNPGVLPGRPLGHPWETTPKDAQERLRILRFWDNHGPGPRSMPLRSRAEPSTAGKPNFAPRTAIRPRSWPRVPPPTVDAVPGSTRASRPRSAACVPFTPIWASRSLALWCEEHGLARPSLSSTGNWPSGSCSPTPNAHTRGSASHLRYPSSFTTNPSANGGGLVQDVDKRASNTLQCPFAPTIAKIQCAPRTLEARAGGPSNQDAPARGLVRVNVRS